MSENDLEAKLRQFQAALDAFVERVKADRWILAVVVVGSINEETIWRKDGIGLWVVEADGVTRRKKSDGEEHRIWRTMVALDVNLWAEVIPRTRFKRMVEGTSRTAFSYNFFARRQLIYSTDESITNWFEEANSLATRDQKNELLITTCWVIHGLRHARRVLTLKKDPKRTWQVLLDVAHSLASAHLVEAGEICETHAIYQAMELNPEFFEVVYTRLINAGPDDQAILKALEAGEGWLRTSGTKHLDVVLKYLGKQPRAIPLSEIADHFAFTQLYPWYLEAACEWLVESNQLEKLAAEMLLTKKSRQHVEEPAYLIYAA